MLEYTKENLPEGWYKGIVVVKMFDGIRYGKCVLQKSSFMLAY